MPLAVSHLDTGLSALDSRTAARTVSEMIVVFVSGTTAPGAARAPCTWPSNSLRSSAWWCELIPYIDANFRTPSDQPHRAMAGLSMGGMETKIIRLKHLDQFSLSGLFSGGVITPADVEKTSGFRRRSRSYSAVAAVARIPATSTPTMKPLRKQASTTRRMSRRRPLMSS